MTLYGWDASNHDWARGPMDLTAARRDGISLFTHKATEGLRFYTDPYIGQAMNRAHPVGFAAVGGYHVLHPAEMGAITAQADWFVDSMIAAAPWWNTHPCFVWQIDAEKFDYMNRAPSVAEINQFGDRIVARTGCSSKAILVYAPQWLYGAALAGLKYRNLWASGYGANPVGHFKQSAPADFDGRWGTYSGIQPTILQYGSQTTIGSQPICDANVIRVSTEADMQAIFGGNEDMPLTAAEKAEIITGVHDLIRDDILRLGQWLNGYANALFNADTMKLSNGTLMGPGVRLSVAGDSQVAARVNAVQAQLSPAQIDAVTQAVAAKVAPSTDPAALHQLVQDALEGLTLTGTTTLTKS